ncbi:nucleoid-associated protein [Amycolatopsis saalfeldensis]|nr:nucleoid-associated protein [Amycolatopsis saalfeldensis]
MTIEMLTYQYVAPGNDVLQATLREHDESTDEFLFEHFRLLVQKSESGSTPCGSFREQEAKDLFIKLEKGDNEEFLGAATTFTERLVSEMDLRASAGLLVFARFVDEGPTSTAVLKLDVVSAHAGVLRQIADGSQSLEAVRDVLDSPGKLQKGLVTPDIREDSEIFVSDRLTKASEYFLRAFGVIIDARPVEAVLAVVQVVAQEVPDATVKVISVLPKIESGPLDETLDSLVEKVPELAPKRQAIEDSLREQQRPVRRIDTSAGFKAKIIAGAISITGPAAIVDKSVTWSPNMSQGWKVEIASTGEPKKTYNK